MRVAFHTLGCRVNQYESEALMGLFEARGDTIVPETEAADVCIINTCTVTSLAERKSRQFIRRFKKKNPRALIAVMGCYAQVNPQDISRMEEVDLIAGTNEKSKLPEMIDAFIRDRKKTALTKPRAEIRNYEEFGGAPLASSRTRAHLKIQEGCNRFCSYCIVPLARGDIRSRDLDHILDEAREMLESGCRELVLTGINTALYGMEQEKGHHLHRLVLELADLPGDFRIRLSSLEPTVIDKEQALLLTGIHKVCPHLHLSLQSGSDRILKAMNRKYTAESYLGIVEALKQREPGFAVTTDVIVGFPGETDADFEETCNLVQAAGFSKVHIFKYSKRPGTKAALMDGQVPDSVKSARSRALMEISDHSTRAFFEKERGNHRMFLPEEILPDGKTLVGFTENYIRTYLDAGSRALDLLNGPMIPVGMGEPVKDGMTAHFLKDAGMSNGG